MRVIGANQLITKAVKLECFGVKKRGKWRAYIRINRREKFLGYFENFDEAVRIRKQAERDYNFNQNHGSERPL